MQRIKNLFSPRCLTAILVGKTGAGKTTLVNQLCNLDRKAGVGESQTRDIALLPVCHGDAFAIIDTPGTDSDEETYKHSYLLYHALTTKPVNGIFLVVKYEFRHYKIVNAFTDLKAMLPDSCSANLFLIISCWDEATSPYDEKIQILKNFAKIGISDERIIFKGKNSKVIDLSLQMHSFLKKSSPITIKISKEDFYLNFQIADEAKKGYAEYKKEFQKLQKSYNDSITSYLNETKETGEDRDDLLHFLIVDFKDTLSKKLDEFILKYRDTMDALEWYPLFIKLQKQYVALCSGFSDSLQEMMDANLNDPNDPRNLVKRCPHCQLVWIKVEGCDGMTTCGNKVSSTYDIKQKVSSFKFLSNWVNGKLEFQKVSSDWKVVSKFDDIEQKVSSSRYLSKWRNGELNSQKANSDWKLVPKTGNNAKQGAKSVGCGGNIEWKALPRLQESEIKELFNATSIDQVLKIIKDPVFQKTTTELEKKFKEEIPDNLK